MEYVSLDKRVNPSPMNRSENNGTARRQSRFSFYPIFSAISGHSSKGASLGNTPKGREAENLSPSHLDDHAEFNENKPMKSSDYTSVTESLSSKVKTDNSSGGNEDAKIVLAPIPSNTLNLGWNDNNNNIIDNDDELHESSSLLSISHHSLNSVSTNKSLDSEDSMTGLENVATDCETHLTKQINGDANYHYESEQPEAQYSTNDKDERIAILEALEYIQRRRLKREGQIQVSEDNQTCPNAMPTTKIAPPPTHPSTRASRQARSKTEVESHFRSESNVSNNTPPIVPSSTWGDSVAVEQDRPMADINTQNTIITEQPSIHHPNSPKVTEKSILDSPNPLFPISPLRILVDGRMTGWVPFFHEDTLNPFTQRDHSLTLSPYRYTNSKPTGLEEKIESCLESILMSILERSSDKTIPIDQIMENSLNEIVQQFSTLEFFETTEPGILSSPSLTDVVAVSGNLDYNVHSQVETFVKEPSGEGCSILESLVNSSDVEQDAISRCDHGNDTKAMLDDDVSICSSHSGEDEPIYSYDDHNRDEDYIQTYSNNVLGPLSSKGGGTTGVVLHDDDLLDEYDDDVHDSDDQLIDIVNSIEIMGENYAVDVDSVDGYVQSSIVGPLSSNPSSDIAISEQIYGQDSEDRHAFLPDTIETISAGMCSKPTAIMSAFSFDSFKNSSSRKDGPIIDGPLSLSFDEKDNICDNSFVRRLYGHLLPDSMKIEKRKSALSNWLGSKRGQSDYSTEPWDENDPDETGFIKHKISQAQLQHLETEYERLVHTHQLNHSSTKSPIDAGKRRFSSSSSSSLKRAVGEAVEDDRLNIDNDGLSIEKELSNDSDGSLSEPEILSSTVKPIIHSLATNPAFPNAKAAGSGAVGDLEIYHLPIIYKAHQTGFEPTKDLVLQTGTIFAGQYYVQGELGGAAFSVAYRCIDLNSGKKGEDGEEYYEEVCLKVIKNNKDFFDQSLDEIKILELLRQTGRCQENNIIEMKCFFYHKEHLVIVTELLRQNLFEFGKYIAENNEPQYFTRTRLCYIARQCLISLNFIHKMGLVHSDIKPENILLSSYSKARVKVIDFGSSCYLTDRQSSYIQSRSYRAPEVILGLPYDGKIDIWSLGCVIAEMYTGQVTFQNDSVVSMLSRIESICGPFPRHMVESGRVSGQFFTSNGLLFEKLMNDQDSMDDVSIDMDEIYYNVYQPKSTTMSARLGLESGLLERRRTTWEDEEKALFVDFIRKLLSIDPEHRPTAAQALEHPWILSGFNIPEEDLIYPPSKTV